MYGAAYLVHGGARTGARVGDGAVGERQVRHPCDGCCEYSRTGTASTHATVLRVLTRGYCGPVGEGQVGHTCDGRGGRVQAQMWTGVSQAPVQMWAR